MASNDTRSNFDFLWKGSETQRNLALSTPFVQGVKHGTFDVTEFARFAVQDSVYIQKMYGAIKMAASRTEDGELKDFLNGLTEKFKGYYEDALKKLHIMDSSAIRLDSACQDYVHFLETSAQNMETIYFLVSMSPCLQLWDWLGSEMEEIMKKTVNNGAYDRWVKKNFVSEGTLKRITHFINEKGEDLDRTRAMEIFQKGMEHEINFFNSVGNQ